MEKITFESIQKEIVQYMEDVGTYNSSFNVSISMLSKLLVDYSNARRKWEEDGSKLVIEHTNKEGHTNTVKDPLYQSMEKLRMDILTYLKELGLTPSGLKKLKEDTFKEAQTTSKFEELLIKLV